MLVGSREFVREADGIAEGFLDFAKRRAASLKGRVVMSLHSGMTGQGLASDAR